MNDIKVANALGWFSLGVGVLGMAANRRISRKLGLDNPVLVTILGVRDIAAGIGVLAYPDNPNAVWARVAGDTMNLVVLATALGSRNRRRHHAAWAAVGVVGTTVVDVLCATALTARSAKALDTARRTRVKRVIAA